MRQLDPKVVERCVNICRDFLSEEWREAKEGEIIVKPIIVGFANQTFHCILKGSNRSPNEVVVKIYGNELVGKDSVIKISGEAAEAIIVYRLSTMGLAPKLFGVFNGGRIEEYIKHTTATPEHFRSLDVHAVMAKKLAEIHKLDMPISKIPRYFDHLLGKFSGIKLALDLTTVSECDRKYLTGLFDFPLKDEIQWVSKSAPGIGSLVVFSHNDYSLNNVIIRDECEELDDKYFVMDFETSAYNYRGFDLAYFIQLKHLRFVREKEETITDYFEHSFTDEEMDSFLKAYLNEWKRDNPKYDAKRDTFEHLKREVHFFGLQEYLIQLAFITKTHNMPHIRVSLALSEYFIKMYNDRKAAYIKKYGDPAVVHDANNSH